MIINHSADAHGNKSALAPVLTAIVAFFCFGIAVILLAVFYDTVMEYRHLIMRVLIFSAIVLILSVVAFIAVNIFLSLEYRATENQIFKESQQQLQIADNSQNNEASDTDIESRVLEPYDDMTFHNSLSLNQIALDVYGKKGGFYNNLIKEILAKNGREI